MNIKLRKKQKLLTKQTITEKGITLIALVVTIVVLLILAGITITMVLGEDGIIQQAKNAAERTREEEAKAEQDFNKLAGDIQNWVNGGTTTGGGTITLEEAKEKTELFTETTEVTVVDGTMTVPGGFRIKEGNSIKEGIVITDSADEKGNEFVWVPVGNIDNMVMCKTHPTATITFDGETFSCDGDGGHLVTKGDLVGKLYDFVNLSGQTPYDQSIVIEWKDDNYREPDILTESTYGDTNDNLSKYLQTDLTQNVFKEQLKNEFYEMTKSVGKYGGFYIGRYETSLPDGSSKSESKANVNSEIKQNWWKQYKCNKAYAEGNKNLAVVSSTIWGCQYDAMMNWMLSNGINVASAEPKEITNEDIQKNTTRITGAPDSKDKLCNIYDLLGNSFEWTMEAYGNSYRALRGGRYNERFSSRSWDGYYPKETGGGLSSRLSLYVK